MIPDSPAVELLRRLLTAEEFDGARQVWATARNTGLGRERYATCVTSAHGVYMSVQWDQRSFRVSGLASIEVAVRVLTAALCAAEVG